MDKPLIYLFGRNPALMTIVDQQLKASGINARGFMEEGELTKALESGEAGMLVIGGGVEPDPRQRVKELCGRLGVLVLEHWGGPQMLPDDIEDALS